MHTIIDLELFDELIVEAVFSHKHASLLPAALGQSIHPMQRPGRIAFAKILEKKIAEESATQSPLRRTIDGCIDIVEVLSFDSHENVDRRRVHYTSILCARTVNVLNMRLAIQCLTAEDETEVENPSLGALVLAAATGNATVIRALLAQGTLVTDESSFFGSALHAAGEYGQMNVVEIFLNLPTPSFNACIGAIHGGNKEMVEKTPGPVPG